MPDVVKSIERMTDIMGKISLAGSEQSIRVAQVGEAATQMDLTTEQTAAYSGPKTPPNPAQRSQSFRFKKATDSGPSLASTFSGKC
ncbi:hypothetical protein [Rhodoferax ferrireducens]|uniref:hypothetical protein n=1 Tax=Rhodoferax ferrireducens TaxID=192843 RepID=UPI000059A164